MTDISAPSRSARPRVAMAVTVVVVLIAGIAAVLLARGGDGATPPGTTASSTPSVTATSGAPTAAGGDPALLGLYRARPASAGGSRGGRVVAAVPGEPVTLDPFAIGGDTPATRDLAPLWLPGLYRLAPGGVRTPWLAAGPPTVTADGRRVVIDLRPDARWSDGTAITSADVAATWRRVSSRPGPWRSAYAVLAGVETPSPTKVSLVLREPGIAWARLFVAPTGVLPAAALQRLGDKPYDLKVTGGPFTLAAHTRGLETVWRRTPRPWPGSDPLLDEVRAQVVPDFATAVALLDAGRVDAVLPYDAVNAAFRLRSAGGAVITAEKERRSITALTMRTSGGLLKDVRVRRAIALALDRPAFAEGLIRESGSGADGLRVDEAADAPFARWRPDLDQARTLLAAAGWKDNGDRPRTRGKEELTLVLASPAPSDLYDVLSRGMQVQLRRIGVQVDLAGADADRAAELARSGGADLALTRWDTDVVSDLGRLLGSASAAPQGAGLPRWSDRDADRAIAEALAAPTLAAADGPLDRLGARAADQVPVLPLLRLDAVAASSPSVRLVAPVSGYGGPFSDVDRWSR
ncbi:MAG TPA: ABC transporter substrate-binding protein [Mycobacteriales bacterium]|nr:ABC transporter substrate-binding protein [Mycobacteriales bacterium]